MGGQIVISVISDAERPVKKLQQAAHNAASAERIAKFRSEVFINEKLLNGPPVAMFEPK